MGDEHERVLIRCDRRLRQLKQLEGAHRFSNLRGGHVRPLRKKEIVCLLHRRADFDSFADTHSDLVIKLLGPDEPQPTICNN